MSYDNTNKGIIAKNDRKTQDNHPDIAGSINVDGKEYFINGWRKTRSSDGAPFYSLAVKPKAERAAEIRREHETRPASSCGQQPNDYDDQSDIPF
ncbi:hypothetical protein CO661_14010 [Sinorhizobium fredii]|uniref:DUF736 domain-containing protein n=1 Tax=Rhizobium fredii TaxID=380 RepID=A0A2A6LYH4_RHIFR|nr:hypothetical protein [Sinorhizobium fredii]PDT47292.1 hypothetical protein CO661_14010 [Sinorhizobium fredii]